MIGVVMKAMYSESLKTPTSSDRAIKKTIHNAIIVIVKVYLFQ